MRNRDKHLSLFLGSYSFLLKKKCVSNIHDDRPTDRPTDHHCRRSKSSSSIGFCSLIGYNEKRMMMMMMMKMTVNKIYILWKKTPNSEAKRSEKKANSRDNICQVVVCCVFVGTTHL